MDKQKLGEYFQMIAQSGKELKDILSAAQIKLGAIDAYFSLIQKEINKETPSQEVK